MTEYKISNDLDIYKQQVLNEIEQDSDDDDQYLDARDDFFVDDIPNFLESFVDGKRATNEFFNDNFHEAFRICDKWRSVSPMHALIFCMLNCFLSLLSLEKTDIQNTKQKLYEAECLLSKVRKHLNFSSYFMKTNYLQYTEEQLFYEFIMAVLNEASFLMTIFGDQSIISIMKAAIKLKSANTNLRICEEIVNQKKNNWTNKLIKEEFICGFYFCFGGLNLMFSHLPNRVLQIMSFIGFSCDRKKGIDLLEKSFQIKTSCFSLFSGLTMMLYNLYIEQILGFANTDASWSFRIIKELTAKYKNSTILSFYLARSKFVSGSLKEAIQNFEKVTLNLNCKSISNVCNWDLIWCYAFREEYLKAAEIARYLKLNCCWSPAINLYQEAVLIYTHALKTNDSQLIDEVKYLMSEVPKLRIRYAGKTLPPEKFAIIQAETFVKNGYLTEPLYELFYIWNIFANITGKLCYLDPILQDISQKLIHSKVCLDDKDADFDKYCNLLKLKACVLKTKYEYKQSIKLLEEIFSFQDHLKSPNQLLANVSCDMGINYYFLGEYEKAKKWFNSARNDYTGYLAETLVHFKVHNALTIIKSKENNKNLDQENKNKNEDSKSVDPSECGKQIEENNLAFKTYSNMSTIKRQPSIEIQATRLAKNNDLIINNPNYRLIKQIHNLSKKKKNNRNHHHSQLTRKLNKKKSFSSLTKHAGLKIIKRVLAISKINF